jgi:hypothetical protein
LHRRFHRSAQDTPVGRDHAGAHATDRTARHDRPIVRLRNDTLRLEIRRSDARKGAEQFAKALRIEQRARTVARTAFGKRFG